MNSGGGERVPQVERMAAALRPWAEAAGVPLLDEDALKVPEIYVGGPGQRVVAEVADLLGTGKYGLFRRGEQYGTIEADGTWTPMTYERLCTWLSLDCGFRAYKGTQDEKRDAEFSVKLTRLMLASDEFRRKVKVIAAINPVRLPVFRDELDERGNRKLDLLAPGYDERSKSFTLPAPAFDPDMDPNEAVKLIRSLIQFFPWGDDRSMAVQVAGMLSGFCRFLYSGRAPMFFLNANLPGSGKTNLAKLMLYPVFRNAHEAGYQKENPKEVKQELDAAAQAGAPYVFFDDLPPGVIRDSNLNRWVSGSEWQCRVLQTPALYAGQNRAMTVMTGNRVILSPDLGRRSLGVDLFANLPSKDRTLPKGAIEITDEFFADSAWMDRILSALWSLVRYWDDCGRPMLHKRVIGGFEAWSRFVPNIVAAASFGDCMASSEHNDYGDESVEFETLLKLVIDEFAQRMGETEVMVTMRQIVGCARRNGLFIDQLGTVEDVLDTEGRSNGFRWKEAEFGDQAMQASEWMDPSIRSKWGRFFRKAIANGRLWFGSDKSVWRLGDRSSNHGSKWHLRCEVDAAGNPVTSGAEDVEDLPN